MTAPIAYSIKGAAGASGLSQTHLRSEIAAGRLPAKRSGVTEDGEPTGKYLIFASDLTDYLSHLESA